MEAGIFSHHQINLLPIDFQIGLRQQRSSDQPLSLTFAAATVIADFLSAVR